MARKQPLIKTCIFCGSSANMTQEHVFPDWLNDVVPDLPADYVRASVGPMDVISARQSAGRPFNLKPKILCSTCNANMNQWLEIPAKPILGRLIRDEDVTLSQPELLLISRWLVKTACTTDYADTRLPATLPRGFVEEFGVRGDIPPHAVVRLGRSVRDVRRFDPSGRFLDHQFDGLHPTGFAGDVIMASFRVAALIGLVFVGTETTYDPYALEQQHAARARWTRQIWDGEKVSRDELRWREMPITVGPKFDHLLGRPRTSWQQLRVTPN